MVSSDEAIIIPVKYATMLEPLASAEDRDRFEDMREFGGSA